MAADDAAEAARNARAIQIARSTDKNWVKRRLKKLDDQAAE